MDIDIEQKIRRDRRIVKEATEDHIINKEKVNSYTDEYNRILNNIKEETGVDVTSVSEAEEVFTQVKAELHAQSDKVEEILRKVGKLA